MLKSNDTPAFSWSWDEGRYWDHWMYVHFLSGATIGFFTYLLPLSFWTAFFVAFVIMVLFEFFEEYYLLAEETMENHIGDVVIGAVGFFVLYSLLPLFFAGTVFFAVGISVVALNAATAFLGWRNFVQREHFKGNKEAFTHMKEQVKEKHKQK